VIDEAELARRRAVATGLLRCASLSAIGRGVTDPIFDLINEGRYAATEAARRKNPSMVPYSDCGDVGSWLLMRLGVRAPWINRVEMNGVWKVGRNVSMLTRRPYGVNPLARSPLVSDYYQAGDILVVAVISGTTHVTCVIDHDPGTGMLLTSDGGQPGHKLVHNRLEVRQFGSRPPELWRGQRRVDSVLRLEDVLRAADREGALAEPETADQWLLRVGAHPTSPGFPAVQPTLRRGMTGDAVREWQRVLGPPVVADGAFGPKTETATKEWQRARGLVADGVVGPKTWRAADAEEDTLPETPEAKA
jgi:hypothetical protein